MYRLVLLDIDGTILNAKDELDDKLIETIKALQQKGILVGLASGRSFDGSYIYGQKFGCSLYVVYNGGYVILDKEIIHDTRIPSSLAYRLCSKTQDLNGTYIHFNGRGSLSNHPPRDNEYLLPKASISNVKESNQDAHRVVLYLDSEHRALVSQEVEDAACFDEGDRLEIFPAGSKWTGIQSLIKHLDIKPEEVVTIGNGTNDIEMLKAAGLGIAMGNAPDTVKQSADWVTSDSDHHGVVEALIKIFELPDNIGVSFQII